jgi:hypothetical protein
LSKAPVILGSDYPEVEVAFSRIQKLIDHDVDLRNIATHEGFFALSFVDSSEDNLADGETPEQRSKVKNALREFIRNDISHAKEFAALSLDFIEKLSH